MTLNLCFYRTQDQIISFTARERLLINKIMLSDPATHQVILLYNKLPCFNHFQPPSRPSCHWKLNFKPRFHQKHSVHIVLEWVRHDLNTGLLVLWGQNYGIQYLVKRTLGFKKICPGLEDATPNPTPLHEFPQFLGCDPPPSSHPAKTCLFAWIYPGMGYVMHFLTPPLFTDLHNFYAVFFRTKFKTNWVCHHQPSPPPAASPPHTLRPALPTLLSHLYCCSYAMKPDGRRTNHIIVEKSRPDRKETLIISVKLQPNLIHSQLGVISVRNRISRLKKLCIIKPIWRIRHFVDQQTVNAWWIRPRMPLKLYIVYMYSDAHM